ncbi:MAG: hypothetical protein U0174_17195 [Polyangiaceae bacterium]
MRSERTRKTSRAALVIACALGTVLTGEKRAAAGPAELHADDVRIEPNGKAIDLVGNVRVDAAPFHLRSDDLRVTRTTRGLDIDGSGSVTFCECSGGPPLLLRFDGGLIGPPADLILYHPRLELFGLPVLWLPVVWLRASNRTGALPPEIAYRGTDGLFGSLGVHVPWSRDDIKDGINFRFGGYTRGGLASELTIERKSTFTRLRYDLLVEDGLVAESYGAASSANGNVLGWDLDALRGDRAQRMTTALAPASAPFDRARVETRASGSAGSLYSNVRALGPRGTSEVSAWGPSVGARTSGALDRFGVFQAGIVGGTLGSAHNAPAAPLVSGVGTALSFARLDGEVAVRRPVGPIGVSLQTTGAADVLGVGNTSYGRGAGSSTLRIGAPFARAFALRDETAHSSAPQSDLRHWVEPYVSATGLAALGDSPAFGLSSLQPGMLATSFENAAAGLFTAGIENRLGTEASGLSIDVGAGHVRRVRAAAPERSNMVLRYRAKAAYSVLRLRVEGAHVDTGAHAIDAGTRVGGTTYLSAGIQGRTDDDPTLARVVQGDLMAPYYARSLWSATGGVGTLIGERVALRSEATADLSVQRLLGAAGHVEVQDKCRCLVIGLHGSGRIGRPGVDVWLTIDLPTLNH